MANPQQHHQQQLQLLMTIEDANCNAKEKDDDSTNSTDWLLAATNRSVVLSQAAYLESHDPWNHPLMMDCCGGGGDCEGGCDCGGGYDDANAATKRVSLDVTETWMTDEEDDDQGSFAFMDGLESDPVLTGGGAHHHHHHHHHHQLYYGTADEDPWSHEAALQIAESDDMIMMMMMEDDSEGTKGTCTAATEESTLCSSDFPSSPVGPAVVAGATAASSPPPAPSFSSQFRERRALLAASMRASQLSRQCLSFKEHVQLRANLQKVLADIATSSQQVERHCLQLRVVSNSAAAPTTDTPQATVSEKGSDGSDRSTSRPVPSGSTEQHEDEEDDEAQACSPIQQAEACPKLQEQDHQEKQAAAAAAVADAVTDNSDGKVRHHCRAV